MESLNTYHQPKTDEMIQFFIQKKGLKKSSKTYFFSNHTCVPNMSVPNLCEIIVWFVDFVITNHLVQFKMHFANHSI